MKNQTPKNDVVNNDGSDQTEKTINLYGESTKRIFGGKIAQALRFY
jgi:hypothetical protein